MLYTLFVFWGEGMNLAHHTGEAAIQDTGVALGIPFILGLVNMFLLMTYVACNTSIWYSYKYNLFRSVDSCDAENPGNNLYVTGLSARVTDRDLEKHFSTEGEVTFTKDICNFKVLFLRRPHTIASMVCLSC